MIYGYGPLDYYALVMGGSKVEGNLSSLDFEARALDLALEALVRMLA